MKKRSIWFAYIVVTTELCNSEKFIPLFQIRMQKKEVLFRMISENGEDYLYPQKYFAPVQLSTSLMQRLQTRGNL